MGILLEWHEHIHYLNDDLGSQFGHGFICLFFNLLVHGLKINWKLCLTQNYTFQTPDSTLPKTHWCAHMISLLHTSWQADTQRVCVCVWAKYESVLGSLWASKYIPSIVFIIFIALENIHLGSSWLINPWS
jgi:hypothetical protein